jgi:putative PIG3 family NAD(P)H quinone oxidoreductase
MLAVVVDRPGDGSDLRLAEVPAPEPGPGELLIDVAATAVNRADLLQRRGLYPPPPGVSDILGLECAGVVAGLGPGVAGWRPGDRVMALLAGGGYAERVTAPAVCALPVPERLTLVEAAAVPEVFLTVALSVFRLGGLSEGGALLVHGGGSGVGTAAIQMAKAAGATVIVTAGSDEKCRRCLALGADRAVDYRTGDFVASAREATADRGVDVVLDPIGGPYLERNLAALSTGGRLVVIATMGGRRAELDLADLLRRRLTVIGTTLRARPLDEKAALVAEFARRFLPLLADGTLRPVIDRALPIAEAAEAHLVVAASEHFGKVVLTF